MPTNTNARTYAGKSRSFLVGFSTVSFQPNNNNQEDDGEIRESYADLCARWGVDISEDNLRVVEEASPSPGKRKGKGKAVVVTTELPNGMMNDLKSITELRSKGETRRFLDEVGYLFEGLDPKRGIGLCRARYVLLL
jgi:hypothetical protein